MAAPAERPTVTATDRITFTLFLAGVFHALLILGIGFGFEKPKPAPASLDVTLAQYKSKEAPKKADFIAQSNQQGSGDLKDKAVPTTDRLAKFEDNRIREVQPYQQAASQKPVQPDHPKMLTTTGQSKQQVTTPKPSPEDRHVQMSKEERLAMIQRSLEIASLEAQLEEEKRVHARRPRKRQLTSASATESRFAYYLQGWSRKIETVGNLNYPAQARVHKIYGSLRLMVAVKADGSVSETRILESSGHRVLDQAALRIVQLAAPFAPFPPEIRKDTDVLEIIRTWQFEKGDRLSSF